MGLKMGKGKCRDGKGGVKIGKGKGEGGRGGGILSFEF
jgi:hypothetical protein